MTQSIKRHNPHNRYTVDVTTECRDLIQHVCDTSLDAIIIYNSTGRIQTLNATAEDMFGYDSEVLVQEPINLLLPQIDMSSSEHDYLTQMTTAKTAKGKSLHVELMLTEFSDDEQMYCLAIVRDLSSHIVHEQRLSPRQQQVLKLVVQGYTSREIADQLTISIKTVETHRANIMTKLGVRNVSSLVRYALEQSII